MPLLTKIHQVYHLYSTRFCFFVQSIATSKKRQNRPKVVVGDGSIGQWWYHIATSPGHRAPRSNQLSYPTNGLPARLTRSASKYWLTWHEIQSTGSFGRYVFFYYWEQGIRYIPYLYRRYIYIYIYILIKSYPNITGPTTSSFHGPSLQGTAFFCDYGMVPHYIHWPKRFLVI